MVQELLRRFWHGLTDRIDGPLMLITLIIMGFGLATIYSATHDASDRTTAQVMNMLVGIGVMWAVAQIPPQKLMRFAVPLYVLGVILLVLVFFFGIKVNGARRRGHAVEEAAADVGEQAEEAAEGVDDEADQGAEGVAQPFEEVLDQGMNTRSAAKSCRAACHSRYPMRSEGRR